uniref:Ribonuclease A-domain domain-containing protein n=1 Tax=Sus scrofa TaxID=9823 RepID=A0A8D1U3T1_PIG
KEDPAKEPRKKHPEPDQATINSECFCHLFISILQVTQRHCKPQNTFLHDSFQDVVTACNLPNITCKNGQNNCHQSAKPVSLTQCTFTGGNYPNCRYKDAAQYKFFIVACKGDPPYPFVPVHLDKII